VRCKNCNTRFEPTDCRQLHCCPDCAVKYSNSRKKAEKAESKQTHNTTYANRYREIKRLVSHRCTRCKNAGIPCSDVCALLSVKQIIERGRA